MDLIPDVSALWREMRIFEDDPVVGLSLKKELDCRKQNLGVQSPPHPHGDVSETL